MKIKGMKWGGVGEGEEIIGKGSVCEERGKKIKVLKYSIGAVEGSGGEREGEKMQGETIGKVGVCKEKRKESIVVFCRGKRR